MSSSANQTFALVLLGKFYIIFLSGHLNIKQQDLEITENVLLKAIWCLTMLNVFCEAKFMKSEHRLIVSFKNVNQNKGKISLTMG